MFSRFRGLGLGFRCLGGLGFRGFRVLGLSNSWYRGLKNLGCRFRG